jgi:hypothetical protein
LFFTAFLLFCRFVPVIAMAEVKGVLRPHHHHRMGATLRRVPDWVPRREAGV